MATLQRQELIDALTRLGELANGQGETVELLLLGGGAMVLAFAERSATRDVDVVIMRPENAAFVRDLARRVAAERGWSEGWLNDAAKGFVVGSSRGRVVLAQPGIEVAIPSIEQLLAMKLCAWRDDVDIRDARRLLTELHAPYNDVWNTVMPFLQPGRELTAKYAFDDLWDELHGAH